MPKFAGDWFPLSETNSDYEFVAMLLRKFNKGHMTLVNRHELSYQNSSLHLS